MKAFKDIVKVLLKKLGYDIRKITDNIVPVEFSNDEIELYNYVYSNRLTMSSAECLYTTIMACKHVIENSIDGDFVECGVWRGGNAIAAAGMFKLYAVNKNVYLFDTFKGMTEPTPKDVAFSDAAKAHDAYIKNQIKTQSEW